MLKEIERQIQKLEANRQEAFIDRDLGLFLHHLVKMMRPKVIVETGTRYGYSGLWLASGWEECLLYTVEINELYWKRARKVFQSAGMSNVFLHKQDSLEFLENFREKIDLLFLDGSHELEHVQEEIKHANMNTGGLIVVHDTARLKNLEPIRKMGVTILTGYTDYEKTDRGSKRDGITLLHK